MQNRLNLSIVTPNGSIFEGDIKSVVMPGIDGEFGVMPGHSSLVTILDVGVIEFTNLDSSVDAVAINWGHAKISETCVTILVDGAVSISAKGTSDITKNIDDANELVNSVKDSNVSLGVVTSKISSYK